MKKLFAISIALCILLSFGVVFGQNNYLDLNELKGLSQQAQNEIIKKKLEEQGALSGKITNIDPEKAEKWAKIISTTIKTICKDLSIEVNEFVKTPVGKVTLFLIVYKVVGDDVQGVVFGSLGWLLIIIILAMSARYFFGTDKVVNKDESGKVTSIGRTPKFLWGVDSYGKSEARAVAAVVHVALFVAASIAACAFIAG